MQIWFERAEFLERLDKTKRSMEKSGIEVLLASNPANMNYLCGYDGWSFYTHQLVIVALDEPEPIWIGRGVDAAGARFTTYVKDKNLIPYPDDYVQSEEKHPMTFVAELVKDRGWGGRRIGVEMESYYYTARCHEALRAALPDGRFTDVTRLVNWVRSVKSSREIQYMRDAGRIVENAMQAAVDGIRPGVRQSDVVANIYHAQISGTAEFGGDYPTTPPMLPSGEYATAAHLNWTDDVYVTNTGTFIEIAGCRHRYHCPLARTVYLGAPPVEVTDTAEVVVEGIEAALEAAKPGATCEDVEGAWRRAIAASGIIKDMRIGYSVGLNYPPSWGENTMSLRPGDRTVLQPNMTLHMVPGIPLADCSVYISETFRITETGSEPLTQFPRKLFVEN